MFPLPGAPRQAPMDPTRLHAFMTQPSSVATSSALKPTNSRQAKRLLISNVPQGTDDDALAQFFNQFLASLNVTTGGPDPITSVQLNTDKSLGMLEFKNTNDTTVCLAFSGIEFGGNPIDIRRPKDYIVPLVVEEPNAEPGQISSIVLDTPNKLLISRIPDYLQDEQVIELLRSFGVLKAFVLVKDTTDEISKVLGPFINYLLTLPAFDLPPAHFLKIPRKSIIQ
jgi:splicing factor U2AF subunit